MSNQADAHAVPSPDLEQLIGTLRHQLPTLSQRYHVKSLGLFGSYARGEQQSGSDLDVLVEFDEVPSLLTFVACERYLSESTGKHVDLVMKEALKPSIGQRILNEVVPV